MNTEYCLFSDEGLRVALDALHRCRLDECSKCLAVSPPNAEVRLFWADGVVSVSGADFGRWLHVTGRAAPSEQGMAAVLVPNMEAAWRGEWQTRSLAEGEADLKGPHWKNKGDELQDPGNRWGEDVAKKQPTPGVYVWRALPREGEDLERFGAVDFEKQRRDWESTQARWRGYGGKDPWPTEPTVEAMRHFLRRYSSKARGKAAQSAVGVLLAYDGALLDFLATRPLTVGGPAPGVGITVLGGPKGITPAFAAAIKATFLEADVPLVDVCLGPTAEMAHACVAFLRLQDDAGRYRAAVTDLLRLGRDGYDRRAKRAGDAYGRAAAQDNGNRRCRSRSPRRNGGCVVC